MYHKDTVEAKRLTLMLVRAVAAEDGVKGKIPTYWATHVYRTMKEFTLQLLIQTDLLPMLKWTRLGIREVPKGAADFTYPNLEKIEDWLSHTEVQFAPLPSNLYQARLVSNKPGVDFEPRFNPDHIYPFRMISFRCDSAELLLNPALMSPSSPAEPVGWQKYSLAVKRPRQVGTRCRILEGLVTVDSSSLKPPIEHGKAYVVRELGVQPGLLNSLEGKDVSLRLDRARLEAEERAEYLERMNVLRSEGVTPPERTVSPVLELARDLDIDSLCVDSQPGPGVDPQDPLASYQRAYLSDLADLLKQKLAKTALERPPDARLARSKTFHRGSALIIRLDSVPHIPLNSLYIAELRPASQSPFLLCGVSLLSTESQPILAVNGKHVKRVEGRVDAELWEVAALEGFQREYEQLQSAVQHLACVAEPLGVKELLVHAQACALRPET